jgi:hypothetical protein
MNKNLCILFLSLLNLGFSQSFAPAAGQIGSTAIHKDSNVIVSWATGAVLQRGYLDIANPSLGLASYGNVVDAIGPAEGDGTSVVSLGDSGIITLTFSTPLMDMPGPDFAVFENGFTDNYMEFAHVEVSSDGVHFFRFPSVSESPIIVQMDNFSFGDCRYVNNLAGKYRQGYGTPFDLAELDGIPELALSSINYIRIVDVIGSIDHAYGSEDAFGNLINDPYPTPFESGGFDLDAVAVLHEMLTELPEIEASFKLYPNPAVEKIVIQSKQDGLVKIYSTQGMLIMERKCEYSCEIDLDAIEDQVLIVVFESSDSIQSMRVVVNN